jgi:hypothetical protein
VLQAGTGYLEVTSHRRPEGRPLTGTVRFDLPRIATALRQTRDLEALEVYHVLQEMSRSSEFARPLGRANSGGMGCALRPLYALVEGVRRNASRVAARTDCDQLIPQQTRVDRGRTLQVDHDREAAGD